MPCSGRYAEVWEFSAHLCKEAYLTGTDNSGGVANAFLTDTSMASRDFRTQGVQAGVGMTLYNVTQNTDGPVTAVTADTITATGVTWDDGDEYRIATLTAQQANSIELNLELAAGDITMALAAVDACNCTYSTWGSNFLARLNVIIAAAFYGCSCGKPAIITQELRTQWQTWAQTQLDAIRLGKIELCSGATGSDYPAIGWAEQGWSEFAQADIIINDGLRNG